jgi:2-phospho-L-lactate/phosphoenolpyruvate guanylyltransferase
MSLWAIVPVKPLRLGKTRLSGVLDDHERYSLVSTLLGNTLKSLSMVSDIDHILVVSRDPTVLAMANEFGSKTILEETTSDLNLALEMGRRFALQCGIQRLLVLPADLPLLSEHEVAAFVSSKADPPHLLIAPDRRNDGTNALLVSPPDRFEFKFGPGSFQLHVDQAKENGMRVDVYHSTVMELDLDLPEDLEKLKQIELLRELKKGESNV